MKRVVLTTLCVLCYCLVFSQRTVTGTVTEKYTNEPLIGVTVTVPKTSVETLTDIYGKYSLTIPESATRIIVYYTGFFNVEKEITAMNTYDFQMEESYSDGGMMITAYVVEKNPLRAYRNTPMTFHNVSKKELEANNLGQDMPYLLQMTPSVVVTSDAGAGVGYTGIRIRGTDPSRINVTINGVPVNDAESQGVFWVNLPDFGSSTGSVQIQRGVGTSTNGAGAFGGTVNLETNKRNQENYVGLNASYGSFNTLKSNISFNQNLGNKWNINGRASLIQSDGYIDRGRSDLLSYYLSGSYVNGKNSFELINFHGQEITDQAWYGIDPSIIETNRTYNIAGLKPDGTFYENQVDDYQQTYYQFLYKRDTKNGFFKSALHYTRGKGFYEEYKDGEDAVYYNLTPFTDSSTTDLVRRRWLDNHFYGVTASYVFDNNLVVGGAVNNYVGDHFGETIWAEYAVNNTELENQNPNYYEGVGEKLDANIYVKKNYELAEKLNMFIDLQYRYVSHNITGIDSDKRDITQSHSFYFVNPKLGLTFEQSSKSNWYWSYAIANREPNRGDFTDAPTDAVPTFERLHNFEFGNRLSYSRFAANMNVYYMKYDNQLVLTGQINDVGSAIRVNVPNSYRLGLELAGSFEVNDWFDINANATFSQNKIIDFVEYIDDWDNWGSQVTINHGTTDIAFSPNIIAAAELIFTPFKNNNINTEVALMSKYVGKQYIDNTSLETSALSAYFTNDIRLAFGLKQDWAKNIQLIFLVRNVFNELYESNAWMYRYNENGQINQFVGLYPQAGRHFLLGLDLKL